MKPDTVSSGVQSSELQSKDKNVLYIRVSPELYRRIKRAAKKWDPSKPTRSVNPMLEALLEREYGVKK